MSLRDLVPPAWQGLLPGGADAWAAVDSACRLAGDRLAPPRPLVFEALRLCPPDGVCCVVVGQDPYPAAGDAMGLSFSSLAAKTPRSLAAVRQALAREGLAAPPPDGMPPDAPNDLRCWGAQGVLLLNRALTTVVGKRGAHSRAWAPVTAHLVDALCAHAARAGRRLVFLLWGKEARSLAAGAAAHCLLEWTHPSPQIDNRLPPGRRFAECGHFGAANRELEAQGLRPVCWDPCAPVAAAVDGSCVDNGSASACGGFGVAFAGGCVEGARLWGPLEPAAYALRDPANPAAGFAALPAGAPVAATNNRAEYLAGCHALLCLLRLCVRGPVTLVSDSNLFVRSLDEWLPARRARGTEGGLKNLDLLLVAEACLRALRGLAPVRLVHVPSHRPSPPPGVDPAHWALNREADLLAARGRGGAGSVRMPPGALA